MVLEQPDGASACAQLDEYKTLTVYDGNSKNMP